MYARVAKNTEPYTGGGVKFPDSLKGILLPCEPRPFFSPVKAPNGRYFNIDNLSLEFFYTRETADAA